MGTADVDMERVIRAAVRKAMHCRKRDTRRYFQYLQYISRALQAKADIAAAMKEIEGKISFYRPVVFLTPGRSGLLLGRLFLEYLREKERKGHVRHPLGNPVLVTLPVRPRRMHIWKNDRRHPPDPKVLADFIHNHLKDHPLYRRVFERARRGDVDLIYLDAYESSGITRRTYEELAKRFGVPPERFRAVVLSLSTDEKIRRIASDLIDDPSHTIVWKETRRQIERLGDRTIVYEFYAPAKDVMHAHRSARVRIRRM